ncbi:MAG TPA: hypothetical protein VGP93_03760 [Polyangiaceae bacterium]|nr:hypothetical protein [Polyangiaceae bacterium]
MKRHGSLGPVLALTLGVFARPAGAQLPAEGQPIRTNRYTIDLYQGPVLASTRVTGLAGAFVAMAEGVDGDSQNPASPAVRSAYSRDHFDYDLGISLTFPSTLTNTDFFNSGRRTVLPEGEQSGFVFLGIALNLQLGPWGVGLTTDLQRYSLNRARTGQVGVNKDQVVGEIAVEHVQLAHAFADGQVVIGVGERAGTLSVTNESAPKASEQQLFSTLGAGFEAGFVWRPNDLQFRLGGAFRSGVTTEAAATSKLRVLYAGDASNELWLPNQVSLPWDLNLGLAIQFGPRPLNPHWVDPHDLLTRVRRYLAWRDRERQRRRAFELSQARKQGRNVAAVQAALDSELSIETALDQAYLERAEDNVDRVLSRRYLEMKRFHVLVTSSLLISGPVDNAVGLESFLERTVQRSGEAVSLSPRLAIETEVIPRWLKVRAGSYLEPTRFASNRDGMREHGTFGLDLKLFPWTVLGLFEDGTEWRASGAIDAARNYFGWGVAIGVWR